MPTTTVFTDTNASKAWTTRAVTRDDSGAVTGRVTDFDNGVRITETVVGGVVVARDRVDLGAGAGGAQPWSSVAEVFSPTGVLLEKTVVLDDGSDRKETFNANGVVVRREYTDAGNVNAFDVDTRVEVFDDAGVLLSETVTRDDGTVIANTFTSGMLSRVAIEDSSGAHGWTEISRDLDGTGAVTRQVKVQSDGVRITETVTNGVITERFKEDLSTSPAGGAESWTTLRETFDAGGVLITRVTEQDDGIVRTEHFTDGVLRIQEQTDPQDANPNWETRRLDFDSEGRLTEETLLTDEGVGVSKMFDINGSVSLLALLDVDGVRPWSTSDSEYDSSGALVQKDTYFDDGVLVSETYDAGLLSVRLRSDQSSGGTDKPWQEITETFDATGALVGESRLFDDGTREITQYGASGEILQVTLVDTDAAPGNPWSMIVTTYRDGEPFERTTTYDDNRVEVERLVNDDPIADADTATTSFGVGIEIDVLDGDTDADGDTLTIVEVATPTNGLAFVDDKTTDDPSDDVVVYIPDPGFSGTETFTYIIGDGVGGSAEGGITVNVDGPDTVLINEFAANPAGGDPDPQNIELKGTAGTFFSGWLSTIEGDSGANPGVIDSAAQVSGVFDSNGLLTVEIPDYENPSFTLVLSNDGDSSLIGMDVDTNNDGVIDMAFTPGFHVYDAIGLADSVSDLGTLYGAALGGIDLPYHRGATSNNSEAERIFRDGVTNDLYSLIVLGSDTDIQSQDGTVYAPGDFNSDPTLTTNFGTVNESLVDASVAPADPIINEFVANHTSTDTEEFVEIKGDANADYSGFTLLVIEGDSTAPGTIDRAYTLGTTNAEGYWTTGALNNQLENGTQTFVLVEGFTGATGTDLDVNDDGVYDGTMPWTRVVDTVAVNDGGGNDLTYAPTVLTRDFDSVGFTVGGASRIPDGTNTSSAADWVRNDFDGAGIPSLDPGSPDVGEALNTPGAANAVISPIADARINEIHYDNDGSDVGEFVEIRTNTGADVSDMVLELYNGNNGEVYNSSTLSAITPTTDGTYDYYVVSISGIQNGAPDGVALSNANVVTEFLSYEGIFTATNGIANGVTSTDIGVSETSSTSVGFSLQRQEDGSWCEPMDDTPGVANVVCDDDPVVDDPVVTATLISSIQGTGSVSPMEGQTVSVNAIVTYVNSTGFFLQEEEADYDAMSTTSEGIYVYTTGLTIPDIGDGVSVTGTVSEFSGETQITATQITGLTVGNTLPAYTTISLDPASAIDFEALEGMRVAVDSGTDEALQVITNFNFDRFGEFWVSAGEQVQPTQLYDAQTQQAQVQAEVQANANASLLIDDNDTVQNPTAFTFVPNTTVGDNGNGYLDSSDSFDDSGATFRIGTEFTAPITGVLDYGFGDFRVQPDAMFQIDEATNGGARPDAPNVGGSVQVASFNVLNYFDTPTDNGATNPAGQERGADDATELQRQQDKLVQAMLQTGAEVLALQEIENSSTAGIALSMALQDAADQWAFEEGFIADPSEGSPFHDWIFVRYYDDQFNEISQIGTDAITTGLLYNSASLQLVESDFHVFDDSSHSTGQLNRPVTAATFSDGSSDFTVASVHFKSKGGTGTGANADQGDGQGNWNAARTGAAEQLLYWLEGGDPSDLGNVDPLSGDYYTGTGVSNGSYIVMGDFNAYSKEDPVQVFSEATDAVTGDPLFEDLLAFNGTDVNGDPLFDGSTDDAYSFVFDGQQGALDQAFVSDDFAGAVADVFEWHINADEPDLFRYDTTFTDPAFYAPNVYGSSDHDPLVVGLDLLAPPVDDPLFVA